MAIIHVVIPCYNVEKYLDQAVRSVLDQPCKDIDIVLVDDGSPGETPALCDAIAARESRVHAVHKPNGGVSSARNAGIEFVLERYADDLAGRYIAFLDGDDCWESGFLSGEVEDLMHEGHDLLGFQSCTCDPRMNRIGSPASLPEGVYEGGAENVWMHSTSHFGSMLYSCRLLKEYTIRFREGLRYSEDKIFSMTSLYLADRICLKNRLMYLYRIVSGSAMTTRQFGIPYFLPIIDAYLELDRQMLVHVNEKRGRLLASKVCVAFYLMDMVDEHFQQWQSKSQLDALWEERPDYLAALTATGYFSDIQPEPRYQQYLTHPHKYIPKQYALGIVNKAKRILRRLIR